MSYYLFFKYKPASIGYFFLCIGLLLIISGFEMTLYPFQSIFHALCFRVMAFTIWYPSILFYFYTLKDSDNIKIQGISPSCLKPAMKLHFFLNLGIISFFTLLFTLFMRDYVLVSYYTSLGMLALSIFGIFTLKKFLVATLITQGKKERVDIENINVDYLDDATREVLLKQATS